jgi:hypothetical protein
MHFAFDLLKEAAKLANSGGEATGGPDDCRSDFLFSDYFEHNFGYSIHQHVELARRASG